MFTILDTSSQLAFNAAREPNVIQITDGLGVVTKIMYASESDSTFYQRDNDAIFPVADILTCFGVATRNGIGGFTETRYSYQGSKGHLQGIGPLGHRMTKDLSVETGIST
jgi:hypothetical protein